MHPFWSLSSLSATPQRAWGLLGSRNMLIWAHHLFSIKSSGISSSVLRLSSNSLLHSASKVLYEVIPLYLNYCCSVTKLCPTFVTPWAAAWQTPLSSTISGSLLKLMFIESGLLSTSHPLPPPSLLAFSLSQHQGLFQLVGSFHQVAKVLELQLQHQSFQWILEELISFRIHWFALYSLLFSLL